MPTKLEVAPAPNLRTEQATLRSLGFRVVDSINVVTAEDKVNACIADLNRKQAKYRISLNGPKLSIWLPEGKKLKAPTPSKENEKSLLSKSGYRFSQMILLKTSVVTAEFALNSVNLSKTDYKIILNRSILEIWIKSAEVKIPTKTVIIHKKVKIVTKKMKPVKKVTKAIKTKTAKTNKAKAKSKHRPSKAKKR